MRRINVETITQNIKEMCIEANHFLSPDMKKVFDDSDLPGYRNGGCVYQGRTGCTSDRRFSD